MVVGDAQGTVHLYNHEKCTLITSWSTPPLPDYRPIFEKQKIEENIVYVTCPQSHETLKAVTALKFSPRCIYINDVSDTDKSSMSLYY